MGSTPISRSVLTKVVFMCLMARGIRRADDNREVAKKLHKWFCQKKDCEFNSFPLGNEHLTRYFRTANEIMSILEGEPGKDYVGLTATKKAKLIAKAIRNLLKGEVV